MLAYLLKISFHVLLIAAVDDIEKLFQLHAYLHHLIVGIGVEEDLLQQVVVFGEHALCYLLMALEGCSGCVLMFHQGGEDERRDERNAQRISDGTVVLVEGVLVDMQADTLIEVAEEAAWSGRGP